MGCTPKSIIVCQRAKHLNIYLLFLLISSFTHVRFLAEGRRTPRLVEASEKRDEDNVVMVRSLIGSRPPRCDRRCGSCGHCEPIQVPIVPSIKSTHQSYATRIVAYSRGDDISNYKPMCWKCKCGDFIFNP